MQGIKLVNGGAGFQTQYIWLHSLHFILEISYMIAGKKADQQVRLREFFTFCCNNMR